jgi:hypothetical protein
MELNEIKNKYNEFKIEIKELWRSLWQRRERKKIKRVRWWNETS